jgi:hypothetical protein
MKHVLSLVLLGVLAVAPVSAFADWDHEVKYNQLEPYAYGLLDVQLSFSSSAGVRIVADDFLCSETGYITDIEFWGFCPEIENLDQFSITFWSDAVSPTSGRHHPDELMQDIIVDAADASGIGWKTIDAGEIVSMGERTSLFKINLPKGDWFTQQQGDTYWIGIQALLFGGSRFSWCCRAFDTGTIPEDAVEGASMYPDPGDWLHLAWADTQLGLGVEDEVSLTELGYTLLQSADMSFKLTGTLIPEPATCALVVIGATVLAALRRRRGV